MIPEIIQDNINKGLLPEDVYDFDSKPCIDFCDLLLLDRW
jgi:hypothetical protein